METKKVVCPVCGGKGGWRLERNHFSEPNWHDCFYCDSYGFVEQQEKPKPDTENPKKDNKTDLIKSRINNRLYAISLPTVDIVCNDTDDITVNITAIPLNLNRWVEIIKKMLMYADRMESIDIRVIQEFFYNREKKIHGDDFTYEWTIIIKATSADALEVFVDLSL